MSNPNDKIVERLTRLLSEAASEQDLLFHVPANISLTVLRTDTQQFKKAATTGDETLLFTGIRFGKRNAAIFVFEPADNRPWSKAEIEVKSLADQLPGFSDFMIEQAAAVGSKSATVHGSLAALLKEAEKLMGQDSEVTRAKELAEAAAANSGNSLFGMF